jgi:hypothetical protein
LLLVPELFELLVVPEELVLLPVPEELEEPLPVAPEPVG